MKKTLNFTYATLVLLTIATALISKLVAVSGLALGIIMGIAMLKFVLVSFQFMELKKANSFWKVSLLFVLGIIVLVLILIR